jgi:Ca-activated chloride channel family protein
MAAWQRSRPQPRWRHPRRSGRTPIGAPTGAPTPEAYEHLDENGFRRRQQRSALDVLGGRRYRLLRQRAALLNEGRLPEPGAVRIEELVNYFRLPYRRPTATTRSPSRPSSPSARGIRQHRLALIGIQGRQLPPREPAPRNLVFLLDVSGSMMPADKLPLVQSAMRMLVDALSERDRVAIVVYAGASGLVLPSTPAPTRPPSPARSRTCGPAAPPTARPASSSPTAFAREHFIRGGVNRVVLATDGDFNVGVTSQDALVRLIEQERESGVFLSVLGVGTGNLKDSTMEKLADKGNGNYAYLDSMHEARKVLVRELGGTLTTIAKDVKIQVEFNPLTVDGYRLIRL